MKMDETVEMCDCVHTHEHIQKKVIPDENTLYGLADLFKVFGDPTRIRILYALSAAAVPQYLFPLQTPVLIRTRKRLRTVSVHEA